MQSSHALVPDVELGLCRSSQHSLLAPVLGHTIIWHALNEAVHH